MQGVAAMKAPWTEIYDTRLLLKNRDPEVPLVVGGGHGRDLARMLEKHPEEIRKGDLVLQDLPEVVAIAKPDEKGRIRCVAHDFFTRQTIYGEYKFLFLPALSLV
jgi:hypothetical protein